MTRIGWALTFALTALVLLAMEAALAKALNDTFHDRADRLGVRDGEFSPVHVGEIARA